MIIWLKHMYTTTHFRSCVIVERPAHTQTFTVLYVQTLYKLSSLSAEDRDNTYSNGRCVFEGTRWYLRGAGTTKVVKYEWRQRKKRDDAKH